jgi:glycosyltransferase involved in cell wall biosynthesis
MPVVCNKWGVYVVRPLPGSNPPSYLEQYIPTSKTWRIVQEKAKQLFAMGEIYVSGIVRHFLWLLYAIFRVKPVRFIFEGIDFAFQRATRFVMEAVYALLDRQARLTIQQTDIFFCPAYWHDVDPAIFGKLDRRSAGVVILIHDVLPITHGEYYEAPWKYEFRRNARLALCNASLILTVSGYTAASLRSAFPLEAQKTAISVAPNGYKPLSNSPLPKTGRRELLSAFEHERAPFIVVGSIEPKKGHGLILDALSELWDERRVFRKLVVIGRPGWKYDSIVGRLGSSEVRKHVLWFRDLSDADLDYCYRKAHCLIFASVAEGFGIPLIEAAMLRVPIIARRSAVSEEVIGDFAEYFDGTKEDLKDAIIRLEDGGQREEAAARLMGFRWPTWRECVPSLFDRLVTFAGNWSEFDRHPPGVSQTDGGRGTCPHLITHNAQPLPWQLDG